MFQNISRQRPGLVLALVCAAIFMLMLDATVVAAALSDIRADFDVSIDGIQWVVDAYALPLAGLLLTFATVGDRYGRRRVFLLGMAVFTASSLALALSGSALMLNGLRAVQGVGAAMLFATALPLLAGAYPDARARLRAIGIYSAVMGGATAAGPVVGGALVTAFGWRSIFLLNVPVGLVVLIAAARGIPESSRQNPRGSDWPGSVLLTASLVLGVLALTRGSRLGWHSPALIALASAAIALFVVFILWQSRARHPLFDLGMLRKPGFVGTAVTAFAFMATLMAAANYLAIFLIGAYDLSPLQMGLRVLPITLGALVAAPIAARILQRVPFSIALPASLAMVVAGLWLLGGVAPGDDWTHFLPGMIVGGLGLGAATSANQAASLTFAPEEDAGMSSATFATMRQLGMAMGVAVLGVVFDHAARTTARDHLDALGATLPHPVADRLVDGMGAGAGVRIADGLPDALHPLGPALAHAGQAASLDGLNALISAGTWIGAVAVVIVVIAFAIDARRSRRSSRTSTPAPTDDRAVRRG